MNVFNNSQVYHLSLYTDGACSGNPGPGGYAAVLVWKNNDSILRGTAGREKDTTNNAMELRAIAEGLELINQPATVYTDSNYAFLGITDWIWRWKENGWHTTSGSSVKNQLLWKRILTQLEKTKITIRKVKAHSGNKWNEYVDSMAQTQIRYQKQLEAQERKCKVCKFHYKEKSTKDHCEKYHTLYPEYVPCKFFKQSS